MSRRVVVTLVAALLIGVACALALTSSPNASVNNRVLVGAMLGVAVLVAVIAVLTSIVRANSGLRVGRATPLGIAQQLGLTYEKKADKGFARNYGDLPGLPKSGIVKHLIYGRLSDRQVVALEHTYMVHTGQASVPIVHSIYTTATPEWPSVTILPRGILGRLFRRVGFDRSVELELPEFNRMFRVKAADVDFAITLLSEDLQRFILEKPSVRWYLGAGRLCLLYRGAMKADRIEASFERLMSFAAHIPVELDAWSERHPTTVFG